ncbi:MAG: Crp/Fnr family transcriptional regulator [Acidobacteriota bacterium]
MPDSSTTSRSTRNSILNNLPEEDYQRLLPDLELVDLPHGQFIYRPDEQIKQVYFPNNSMVSLIATTPEGQSAEVGVIGFEGIVGSDVLMGVDSTSNESIVQLAGGALRIGANVLKEEFNKGVAFHDLSLRFIHNLMAQISQTALCNRLHTVEERLSRWLLMCRDRSEDDIMHLTQEFLAIMLGTQRATVTVAAIHLQSANLIKYSRGNIIVTDRKGLEEFTCECYQVVKEAYER